LQLILVTIVPLSVVSLGAVLPVDFRVKIMIVLVSGIITLILMTFVDAATIRLVAAEKRLGWRKILGDKTEPSATVAATRR
jgi:hypothetical protein